MTTTPRSHRLLLLPLLAAALTAGCAVEPDAYEPDNDEESASSIGIGESQNRTLHSGDVDIVHLSLAAGQAVTVTADVLDSRIDTVLQVREGDRFLGENDDYGWTLGSQLVVATDADTVLTLEVRPYFSGSAGHYQLRIDEATGLDAFEPDDWAEEASPLLVGEDQAHTLHVAADVDWTRVETIAGETYTAQTLIPSGSGADTVLCLFDGDGIMWADDDDSGEGVGSLVTWVGDGQPWWVMVLSYDPWYGMGGAYTLTLDGPVVEPTPTPTDPVETPTPAEPTEEAPTPTAEAPTDEAPSPSPIEIPTDPEGTPGETPAPTPTAPDAPSQEPPTPTAADGDPCGDAPVGDGDIGAYRPDAYEPDNAQVDASRLRLGEAQQHNFHTGTDVDWARFTAEGGATYRVTTTVSKCAVTDPVLAVVDEAGVVLAELDEHGGETVLVTAPADGDLFVKVLPYNRDGFGPYELKVSAVAD